MWKGRGERAKGIGNGDKGSVKERDRGETGEGNGRNKRIGRSRMKVRIVRELENEGNE